MKIAVISGGFSPERDVSLSSGALIANALVRGGHAVAFADLFFGLELPYNPDTLFRTTADYSYTIPNTEPDLDAVRRQRKNGDPAPRSEKGSFRCASAPIWSFWHCTAHREKTVSFRHCSICTASATPARDMQARSLPWIRTFPNA